VIIDPSGVILTNNHVVEGAGKITVRLRDGREFEATDVKCDPKADLAILRIKGAGTLTAAKFGNSDEAQVGDWVLALGDPFGLEGTVTAGIISARGRPLGGTRASFIQTDAAINPGNSGGPLVNLDGEVVGINTAISTSNGGNQGVGFAIASNTAKWVSQQLSTTGMVKRAFLGVAIQPVEQELARQLGVEAMQGVLISEVQAGAPAAEAGMKPGDVIVEFGGTSVKSPQELQQAVDQAPIGQKQPVVVVRDGKRKTLEVTAREQPAEYGLANGRSLTPGKGDRKLGVEVSALTDEVAEKLGVKSGEGVVITEVRNGSPAQLAGLSTGMVIVQVGQKPVKSAEEFRAAMEKQSLSKGVMLLVRSGQGTKFVVIRSN
jgi:serine protease Do